MVVDLREILPSVGFYRASRFFMLVQLLILRTRRVDPMPPRPTVCAASGMACFLPVLVWGIESVFHAHRTLFGESRFCFGIPMEVFAEQGTLSAAVAVTLV